MTYQNEIQCRGQALHPHSLILRERSVDNHLDLRAKLSITPSGRLPDGCRARALKQQLGSRATSGVMTIDSVSAAT